MRFCANRVIPIGGPNIHCEPPPHMAGYRPQSDSGRTVPSLYSVTLSTHTPSMLPLAHAFTLPFMYYYFNFVNCSTMGLFIQYLSTYLLIYLSTYLSGFDPPKRGSRDKAHIHIRTLLSPNHRPLENALFICSLFLMVCIVCLRST